jgi:mRNA-degrading endonuclease YafQ of YafQ-DinJ toxin-antitoxin module
MKTIAVYYSSHFEQAFRKLPSAIKKKAAEKEIIFRADVFDARLKTHKLKGELSDYWSFSVDFSHRILFEFQENCVVFLDIGQHSIYR